MFEAPKKIIYITRGKLTVYELVDIATKKFGRNFEVGWEEATLELSLLEIIKKFGPSSYRLLLSDDLAYVARFSVPASVTQNQVRGYVFSQLQEKVPDSIAEGEWDYKEIRSSAGGGQDVIAFALVKSFAKALADAVAKSKLDVEAIEPETISKTRDANAYIGIALKTDIQGRDEDVLNVAPPRADRVQAPTVAKKEQKTAVVAPPQVAKPPRQPSKLWLKLLVILIPVVFAGILVGGFLYLRNNIQPDENQSTDIVQESATPTESSAPENMPETSELDLPQLKVQVLNGSGISGEADKVSDLLFNGGFSDIVTANAGSFDFVDTLIQTKESADFAYSFVEQSLNGKYALSRADEYLGDDVEYDVIITVGQAL